MQEAEKPVSKPKDWKATVALALSMLLASLGTSIANIALPAMMETFAAPFVQVQAIVVAYLATLTVTVVIAGRLGDRFGLRTMLIAGQALFLLASLMCAIAPDLWLLIGARALQGIGAAFLMTLSMALMRHMASEDRIGRAMGLLGTVSALGTALGPSFGGFLIPVSGWRGIFWLQVPLAAVAFALASGTLPADSASAKRESSEIWTIMNKSLAPSLILNLLVASVMMTTLVVGPFYLGRSLGLIDAMVGLVMSLGPLISIVSGVPSGQLVDARGARLVLAVGLIMLAAGAVLMAILPQMLGVGGYILAIVVLTPGYQLFQAANNTAVLTDIPKERRGSVSGLLNLSRNAGLILGASAMSGVFAFGVGTNDFVRAAPAEIAAGMQLAFLLAGALMVIALVIALANPLSARHRP
jgi:MFS family permease